MSNKLGNCQYRHDWIDGKCNTCGQIEERAMNAPEAKGQGEDESTLRLKITELEDQLSQRNRALHWIISNSRCEASRQTAAAAVQELSK